MTTTTEALMALAEDFADHYRSDKRDEIRAELASALAEVVKGAKWDREAAIRLIASERAALLSSGAEDSARLQSLTEDLCALSPTVTDDMRQGLKDALTILERSQRDQANIESRLAALAARSAEQKGV